MLAREVRHRVVAIDEQHALLAGDLRDLVDDAGVARILRQALDVLGIDQHDVDLMAGEPSERLPKLIAEIVGIDACDRVIRADLPDDQIGLQLRNLGLEPLRCTLGHLARLAAREHLDAQSIDHAFEIVLEANRIARERRRGADAYGRGGAKRDDANRALLQNCAAHGAQRRAAFVSRAFYLALAREPRASRMHHRTARRWLHRGLGGGSCERHRPLRRAPVVGLRDGSHGAKEEPGHADADDWNSEIHAVILNNTKPVVTMAVSSRKVGSPMYLTIWPASASNDATQKTARELRPRLLQ